jgi:preprotein translocase subunit SecG
MKMHKIIYISVLLMTFLPAVQAQEKFNYEDISLLQKNDKTAAPVEDVIVEENTKGKIDDTPVAENDEAADTALYQNNVNLPYDSISNWRNQREYAYTRYLDSLLKNKKKKEVKPMEGSSGQGIFNSLLNSGFIKVLLWTLAILFVLFIIYRLFLAEGMFQQKSKQSENGEAEAEVEVITKESDFDALIRLALQNSNYRQAVRYQYLRTLHALAGKHFIQLAPGKTNFHYVHEIANRSHQLDFASLTLNYEYVWYGEFNIEKDIYQKIETKFISLNQKL